VLGLWLLRSDIQPPLANLRPPARAEHRGGARWCSPWGRSLATLLTLELNQNVRVALVDARASNSRSVMLALEPLLAVLAP
jgi:hypothetical protein